MVYVVTPAGKSKAIYEKEKYILEICTQRQLKYLYLSGLGKNYIEEREEAPVLSRNPGSLSPAGAGG